MRVRQGGFTLIEIVVVITLLVVISGLAISRFDSLLGWRQRSDIRRFVDTWQFLYNESAARREGYRLIVDFDSQSYYVRREVLIEPSEVQKVDFLRGLRTDSEKKRLNEKDQELGSLEDEYKDEDKRLGGSVENLYFQALFGDPNEPVKLTRPTEFPSLAERHELTTDLQFRDVTTRAGKITEGAVPLRFSPRGGTDFAVVHLKTSKTVYTITMSPTTGEVKLLEGDEDLDWGAISKQSEAGDALTVP